MNATTINPAEVARFNQLAETWWDRAGPMWPLHRLNELRVPYIEEHVRAHFGIPAGETLEGLNVLDVGCGAGILSESMAKAGATVHGIDVAEKNIEIARQHEMASGLGIRYDSMAVEDIQDSAAYDLVLNMEVVEHVEDLPAFMSCCANLVRPGGLMIIATINRTAYSMLTAKLGAEYVLGWLPRGTHSWFKFVTPSEAFGYLREEGFAIRNLTGVGVNPLKRSMYLTDFRGANYMMVAIKAHAGTGTA
jgi:2-polyprenyl-6-hydroxyphenyl methylase/3-demethylubiquinone-9 3-methyltransferase